MKTRFYKIKLKNGMVFEVYKTLRNGNYLTLEGKLINPEEVTEVTESDVEIK